ncbi:hypothetical protein U1Q18_006328 [Sarracenia purpurea var. burkii]
MAKVPVNTFLFLRRPCSVAAENARLQTAVAEASATRKGVVVEKEEAPAGQKEVFWMKDPKSGYWIPESHFNQIDVAEIREKLLRKKAESA